MGLVRKLTKILVTKLAHIRLTKASLVSFGILERIGNSQNKGRRATQRIQFKIYNPTNSEGRFWCSDV